MKGKSEEICQPNLYPFDIVLWFDMVKLTVLTELIAQQELLDKRNRMFVESL